ncbi:MAG: hypothetical protein AMJ63_04380 [Myxococcales bacterium SG8_38_1]|nr:MAG: hypothetical protein AMJ63_04380 [Myxococcales bacterium SG8_38_1]
MRTTTRSRCWLASAAFTACLIFSASVEAEGAADRTTTTSVEDRAKAAEAYDHGTSAYLSEHYELAAHWFERAYRVAPTSAALLQAVRAHIKAGNSIRAADLAVELRDKYPEDERAKESADAIVARVAPTNVLVTATCDKECTLELDGALVRHSSFFVAPNVEHILKAAYDDGETSTSIRGEPGSVKKVTLVAPAAPPPPPVPKWAFFSSLGATVALGAVTVWSGVDANRGVSAYETAARAANSPGINNGGSPTPAEQAESLLEDGQQKERRTNILIGVTATMAVSTAVLGVFTNWKGESREPNAKRVEASIGVTHDGGALMFKGRF